MKQSVGIKLFKAFPIILCIVFVCAIIGSAGCVIIKNYRTHYTKETYLEFNTERLFNDLFYDSFAEDLYGVGIISKSFNKEQKETAYWVEKGVKLLSDKQIDECISLLRKMEFHPLEKDEAFRISLLCTKKRSLTTIQLDETPILRSDVVYNPLYSQIIYDAMIEEGFGVYEAGFFQIKDRYYMLADLVTHNTWVEMLERENPDFYKLSRAVFEIEPSKEITELSCRRDEFYVSFSGFETFSIPWSLFGLETKCFVISLVVWLVLWLFVIKKRFKKRLEKVSR